MDSLERPVNDPPRGYTIDELLQAARRQLRSSLAAAGGLFLACLVAIALTPDEYRAEATIVLEPYRPHAELVTPAATTMLEERLRIARQQLLATPRLSTVVTSLNLFPEVVASSGIDAAVERLKRHLEVRPDGDGAVVVGYRTGRRDEAAAVVRAVAEGFVAANAELRIGQASRLLGVLTEELRAVSEKLAVQEERVRAFRLLHDGELPEQVEANLREAERASHLLEAAQMWQRDVQRRRALMPQTPTSAEVERLAAMQNDLHRQLNHAKAQYFGEHPEIVRLQRELDGLAALKDEARSRADGDIQSRESLAREARKSQREIAVHEAVAAAARDRAASAARWASEISLLERDRDLLREKYRSLVSRRVESEIALGLERVAAPLATRIVDPPTNPTHPVAPDRLRLSLVALAAALAAGLAFGAWREGADPSLRSPAEVRRELQLPLLAVIPGLEVSSSKRS